MYIKALNKFGQVKKKLIIKLVKFSKLLGIPLYKVPYVVSYCQFILQKIINQPKQQEYDLVFVIDKRNKGWILDAVCKEIAKYYNSSYHFSYAYYYPGNNFFSYSTKLSLPSAKAYFFAHYSYFAVCLRLYPLLWERKSFIYYTHPKGIMDDKEFVYIMSKCTQVICMCSQFAERMINCGLNPQQVTYALGAADPEIFRPHQRTGHGVVGFCTAYYERKNPDLILDLVKSLPHHKFILLGKNWKQYAKFMELTSLTNFSYIEAPYEDYPEYYAKMDVFVSPAKLEGGPIPLIETMMCNIVPVASVTGFAPDIITHGENGLLFEIDSSAAKIAKLIEQAFEIKTDIRSTVENLSWKNFSLQIQQILQTNKQVLSTSFPKSIEQKY